MDKFYQACYTRLGGADRNSGWQLTNTSPDIPAKVLNMFEQRQRGNEPVGRKTPKNVSGEHLCAMEIGCEADIVSLSRIQYGVPCYGREGLYSHGFLFPSAYELLKDPNRILALSKENFCFRGERPAPAEELELYQQRTSQIPEQLIYEESWTVERAKARTGMNDRIYKEFVCCLYGNWAKSARTPIFVKTDGTEEMAKAVLYLAYAALPYSMRTKLTASTFVDAKNASLILTHEQPDGCRCFDPSSGMNNVLTSNQRKRWERMLFVSQLFENKEPWFGDLERVLTEEMEDRYSQDPNTLQTACQIGLFGEDQNPVEQLYNFLEISQDYTDKLERRVAGQLEAVAHIVTAQGLGVSDDMENLLNQRLENARTRELREAGKSYKIARLLQMNVTQACAYLRTNTAIFEDLRGELQMMERGREILAAYYHEAVRIVTEDAACTYENLVLKVHTFCDIPDMGDLWKLISEKAKKIAEDQAGKALKTAWIGTGKTPLCEALDAYADFLGKIENLLGLWWADRQDLIEGLRRDISTVAEKYIREYDGKFQCGFFAKRIPEYEQFYWRDFKARPDLGYSRKLLELYQAALTGDLSKLEEFRKKDYVFYDLESNTSGIQQRKVWKPQDERNKESIEKSLYAYWTDAKTVQRNSWMHEVCEKLDMDPSKQALKEFQDKDNKAYDFWLMAAELRETDLISLAVEKDACMILSKENLERSIMYNGRCWSDERLKQMIRWCEACDSKKVDEALEVLKLEQWARNEEKKRREQTQTAGRRSSEQGKKESGKGPKKEPRKESGKKDNQPGVPTKFTDNKIAGSDDMDAFPKILSQQSTQVSSAEPATNVPTQETSEKKGGIFGLLKRLRS